MMRVAITGGTGFIGRTLVAAHLERGDAVRVLTRHPGTQSTGAIPYAGDLAGTIPESFVDGADVIYHLAAEILVPDRMHLVNVVGTQRLLSAALGRFGRWVQLSSVGVYGPPRDGLPIDELTNPHPANAYERSKLEADRAVAQACDQAGCGWGIVRPSNVIAANMRNQSPFALVRAIIDGRFAYVGPRSAMSTYIHVNDVVQALMLTAGSPAGTVVNISSDCPWTALVERICARAGCSPPRIRIPATVAHGLARVFGESSGFPLTPSRIGALSRRGGYPDAHAREVLGYKPSHPMPAGFDEITDAEVLKGQ